MLALRSCTSKSAMAALAESRSAFAEASARCTSESSSVAKSWPSATRVPSSKCTLVTRPVIFAAMVARRRGVTYPLAFRAVVTPPISGFVAVATSTTALRLRSANPANPTAPSNSSGKAAITSFFPVLLLLRSVSPIRSDPRSGFDEIDALAIVAIIPHKLFAASRGTFHYANGGQKVTGPASRSYENLQYCTSPRNFLKQASANERWLPASGLFAAQHQASGVGFRNQLSLAVRNVAFHVANRPSALDHPSLSTQRRLPHRPKKIDLEFHGCERFARSECAGKGNPHRGIRDIAQDSAVHRSHRIGVLRAGLQCDDGAPGSRFRNFKADQFRDRGAPGHQLLQQRLARGGSRCGVAHKVLRSINLRCARLLLSYMKKRRNFDHSSSRITDSPIRL